MSGRNRRTLWLAATLLAAPTLLWSVTPRGVHAASTEGIETQPGAPVGKTGAQILGAVPEPPSRTLDRIREEGEAVLAGTHWSYDPAGRRDPFRSLVENVAIKGQGERPKGIAGMLIGEVDLVGIVASNLGPVAFLNGSDNRGYFLREGDTLYDGTIVNIDRSAGRVIFRQKVEDPREIKPYREVTKKLHSSTEDGQ